MATGAWIFIVIVVALVILTAFCAIHFFLVPFRSRWSLLPILILPLLPLGLTPFDIFNVNETPSSCTNSEILQNQCPGSFSTLVQWAYRILLLATFFNALVYIPCLLVYLRGKYQEKREATRTGYLKQLTEEKRKRAKETEQSPLLTNDDHQEGEGSKRILESGGEGGCCYRLCHGDENSSLIRNSIVTFFLALILFLAFFFFGYFGMSYHPKMGLVGRFSNWFTQVYHVANTKLDSAATFLLLMMGLIGHVPFVIYTSYGLVYLPMRFLRGPQHPFEVLGEEEKVVEALRLTRRYIRERKSLGASLKDVGFAAEEVDVEGAGEQPPAEPQGNSSPDSTSKKQNGSAPPSMTQNSNVVGNNPRTASRDEEGAANIQRILDKAPRSSSTIDNTTPGNSPSHRKASSRPNSRGGSVIEPNSSINQRQNSSNSLVDQAHQEGDARQLLAENSNFVNHLRTKGLARRHSNLVAAIKFEQKQTLSEELYVLLLQEKSLHQKLAIIEKAQSIALEEKKKLRKSKSAAREEEGGEKSAANCHHVVSQPSEYISIFDRSRLLSLLVGFLLLLVNGFMVSASVFSHLDALYHSECKSTCSYIVASGTQRRMRNPLDWVLSEMSSAAPGSGVIAVFFSMVWTTLATFIGVSALGVKVLEAPVRLWKKCCSGLDSSVEREGENSLSKNNSNSGLSEEDLGTSFLFFRIRLKATYPSTLVAAMFVILFSTIGFISQTVFIAPHFSALGTQKVIGTDTFCELESLGANSNCELTHIARLIFRLTLSYPWVAMYYFFAGLIFDGLFLVVLLYYLFFRSKRPDSLTGFNVGDLYFPSSLKGNGQRRLMP